VRDWLETASVVLTQERPEVRLVNATEGGARIAGFEETSLAALLATLPERHITAEGIRRDAQAACGPLASDHIRTWCAAQKSATRAVRHAARRIRRLCEASRLAIQQNHAHKITTGFHKLEVAERQLKQAVSRMPFVDSWAHADVDEQLAQAREESRDDHDSAVRSVALEAALASVLERSAIELEAKFDELEAKFDELDGSLPEAEAEPSQPP